MNPIAGNGDTQPQWHLQSLPLSGGAFLVRLMPAKVFHRFDEISLRLCAGTQTVSVELPLLEPEELATDTR